MQKWGAIEAFNYLGADTRDKFAWSAQSADKSITVLALWDDQVDDDGSTVTVNEVAEAGRDGWVGEPRNKRRLEHLASVWNGDRKFRVVMLTPNDPDAVPRFAKGRRPEKHLTMTLTDLNMSTGEFSAVGRRMGPQIEKSDDRIERKYDPLGSFLRTQQSDQIELSLAEIAALVGELPQDATTPQFWANARAHHLSRRSQWMDAGYSAFYLPAERAVRFARSPERGSDERVAKNPRWSRDEIILVLNLYVQLAGRDPGVDHPAVKDASDELRQMATTIGSATYRNPSGVIMKMMNFRSLDPAFTARGSIELKGASELDREIWQEFYGRTHELAVAAEQVRAALANPAGFDDPADDAFSYTAKEGRVSYRYHRTLERDPKIVALKKAQTLKTSKKLECEVCNFDFAKTYGARGYGFIEAHHTNPVHAMQDGATTVAADLALLCSNCHRMVHARKPWLKLEELRALLDQKQKVAD